MLVSFGVVRGSSLSSLLNNPNIRPIGHKKAKNELYGKSKKTSAAYSAITEKMDKFM
jgi:hypothetical protein